MLSSTPKEIVGEKQVEKVIVTKDNSDREIIVSGVFVAVGSVPNSDLLKELVKLDNGYVVASEDGVTSADGIFVAGDVRTKKLRQVKEVLHNTQVYTVQHTLQLQVLYPQ